MIAGQRCLWLGLTLAVGMTPAVRGEAPLPLREQFPANYQYHVSSRVEISGSLTLPAEQGKPAPKPLPVAGTSALEYDERVLAAGSDGQVQKAVRIYRRVEFQRKVGDQPQETGLRPQVRRLVILRLKNAKAPFSPDGPLTWGEIELIRTDIFTPALAGLLPAQPVRIGDRWTASRSVVQELTDMEQIDEGNLECKLEEVTTLAGRRHARVGLTGSLRGINEDGPNRQQLDGYFFFDLESNHLSYLSFKGVHILLDKDGKEAGKIEGRFVLTRQAHQRSADLGDDALRGVVLEPNAENTLLLYDNPDLGVRLLYPRRWRVGAVRGKQLVLDETNGSGILLTVEPLARVPSAAQYAGEARDYLVKQKAKVLGGAQPQRLQGSPQDLEHFGLEIDLGGQRATMEYYIARQAQGGATVAARLLPNDLPVLRKEVEGIARSVRITAPQK